VNEQKIIQKLLQQYLHTVLKAVLTLRGECQNSVLVVHYAEENGKHKGGLLCK
jgi:hypothetical protein